VLRDLRRTLYGQGLGRHTRPDIEMLAIRDLDAISALLGDQAFLFGSEPHAVDAVLFGFLASCATPYFASAINDHALKTANITSYVARGMARWFPELVKPA
jgi:glutathione S-transferase